MSANTGKANTGKVGVTNPRVQNIGARAHDIVAQFDKSTSLADQLECLAKTTRDLGLNQVQLALMKSFPEVAEPQQLSHGLGSLFKNILAQSGVDVAIFSCYINLIHSDLGVRQQLLNKFQAYIKYASSFGTRLVVSETGSVLPELGYTADNFTDEAFDQVVQSVTALCQYASNYGIIVGIEPGYNHPIYCVQRTKELLDHVNSPNLGIVLDPFNLLTPENYGEYDSIVEQAFCLFGDRIEAVQLKDFIVTEQEVVREVVNVPFGQGLFGQGVQDVTKFLNYLNAQKPGLSVIFEGTPQDKLAQAVQLLQ